MRCSLLVMETSRFNFNELKLKTLPLRKGRVKKWSPGSHSIHIAIVRNNYAGSYLAGSWLKGLTLLTVARPRRILTWLPDFPSVPKRYQRNQIRNFLNGSTGQRLCQFLLPPLKVKYFALSDKMPEYLHRKISFFAKIALVFSVKFVYTYGNTTESQRYKMP